MLALMSAGYLINRSRKRKHTKTVLLAQRGQLIDQLRIALGILQRPLPGRLKWALFGR